MSIDERDLAARLDSELGTFAPGPLPLDTVIRRGKMTILRRRLTAVAAALAVLAAAVLVPTLIHALRPPPPVAPHYRVTVSPPGPGASSSLVARGTVNGARWTYEVFTGRHGLCEKYIWGFADCAGGPGSVGPSVGPGGEPAILSGFSAFAKPPGKRLVRVQMARGYVRGDVTRLRVLLGNGQILTLRPTPALGSGHGSWVAVAVPFESAIRKVIAYSAQGEVGYAIPFTGAQTIEFGRWLLPGQRALPRAAQRLIGKGTMRGGRRGDAWRMPWSVRAVIGPWGLCLQGSYPGLDRCLPAIRHVWSGSLVARLTSGVARLNPPGQAPRGLVTLQLAQEVRRLVVTGAGRRPLTLIPVRLGEWQYAVLAVHDSARSLHWTAYDRSGRRLGTGRLAGFSANWPRAFPLG